MIVWVQRLSTVKAKVMSPLTKVEVVVMLPQLEEEVTLGTVALQQRVVPVGRVMEPLFPIALQ